ncbi:glucosyltransferase [Didymella heteroderae]|uniref:Dol-P-Glc:Glc(2)Man(9)GlcNAc(2)-PP-Dol alpha-1,2-glucosyltransferase n=1 Tax=Didymella heteroderae TaxID=1769908 RepID=A0A9P4WR37_9PLEO|nr:glucosyltransferase [Didymella heteroderae]
MYDNWQDHVAAAVFAASTTTWYSLVDRDVKAPYLDEFFHVPQAQKYCAGDYTWDPKITTPPGLYLVAKLLSPILGCSMRSLRAQNVFALSFIFFKVLQIRRRIQPRGHGQWKVEALHPKPSDDSLEEHVWTEKDQTPFTTALTAFNIAAFPPLFFFGALYYTDVMSTAAVLISYDAFLKRATKPEKSVFDDLFAVFIGVVALFFRQTNIFWVAVFPAGLTVIEALKQNGRTTCSATNQGYVAILQQAWSKGTVRDRSLRDGGLAISDAVMLLLTTAIAALRYPLKVLRAIIPYVVLLVLFAGFVAWNGSVVLGDKSAHTATIHTPQMLYFWPYIALFSAPILVGPLFTCVAHMFPAQLGVKLGVRRKSSYAIYPSLSQGVLFVACGLIAVHFNTIIHPYTLADNRHYVFYVFRLLLRHPALKYLAVPVYYVCFWLSIQSLAHPTADPEIKIITLEAKPPGEAERILKSPTRISFIIIWLLTTALSVVTAPLVEPRYFIIPWIIWRLHVPYSPTILSIAGRMYTADLRVVVETVWLVAMNQVLQHIFLYKTFTWPSEPGNVQRFLW